MTCLQLDLGLIIARNEQHAHGPLLRLPRARDY